MTKLFPISYTFTMIHEILDVMGLGDKYTVLDVLTFGHDRGAGPTGAIWVEVFTRGERGEKTGTERITRWIERDISYADWGNPPTW